MRPGLDDTVRPPHRTIREVLRSHDDVPDLRTAAYIVALEEVALCDREYAL